MANVPGTSFPANKMSGMSRILNEFLQQRSPCQECPGEWVLQGEWLGIKRSSKHDVPQNMFQRTAIIAAMTPYGSCSLMPFGG